ncbi:hypothetical protein ACLMJK_002635 [Lecanora helva]
MATQKIAVYSLSGMFLVKYDNNLKNTTDDAVPNYLTSLKFKQSHFLTDVRLTLGYTAVIIAAITFYADYKLGWDKTKDATFWAVLVYFTLNGALTFWIWGMEKGNVFTGEIDAPSKGRSLLSIASSVTKHTPIYNLTVRYQDSNKQPKTLELSSPFTRWFDADGVFVAKPFQQWLASEIPLVGQVDPQKQIDGPASEPSGSVHSNNEGPDEQRLPETPKKSGSSTQTPVSARTRKGKKT